MLFTMKEGTHHDGLAQVFNLFCVKEPACEETPDQCSDSAERSLLLWCQNLEDTVVGENTGCVGNTHCICFWSIHTRLNLTRGLPTAHEDPNRKTGDWTEGGDTLDFTGLGKPGERNRFFLSRAQTRQVVTLTQLWTVTYCPLNK